jgi:glycosyltransferase involved in cell wall biosynthesis
VASPRILFVSPIFPLPADTGTRQRVLNVLTAFRKIGRVDLLCYGAPESPRTQSDLDALAEFCHTVRILPEPEPGWTYSEKTYRGALERSILTRRPYVVQNFPGGPLAEVAATLGEGANLLWVVRLPVAEWIRTHRDRMIVDIDDLESIKARRRLALQRPGVWRLLASYDNWRVRALERTAPGRYAALALASENDRAFFSAEDQRRLMVLPNGVSDSLLALPVSHERTTDIVFVGTMAYYPNEDAARWLALEIFPRILAHVPEARLQLVGHDPRRLLESLQNGHRIIATGRVEDVTPYVRRAAVSVVPIRIGAGTRIKILEALALGTPVVSTTIGAEGLSLVPGKHLQIADTADRFAAEVVALLRNPDARARIAAAGRALVAERHTWSRVGERFVREIQSWLYSRRSVRR